MTIAVLSWGAHQTLINTLQSYEDNGLDDSQKLIFFQEISKDDIQIAEFFEYDYIGEKTNIGIGQALRRLVDEATGDFFLFLENDWENTNLENTVQIIHRSLFLLETNNTDVVRLRSRNNPGHPLWTRQFEGREYDRPEHLLDCVHWESDPTRFPEITEVLPGWYRTTSKNANWTNNPTMFRTDWLRKHILPRLGGENDVEKNIQSWWQTQEFKVMQGEGLFTHNRVG